MKRIVLLIACFSAATIQIKAGDPYQQENIQTPTDQGPSSMQTIMGLMATAALANLVDQQLTQRASAFSKEYPTLMFNLGIVLTLIMPKLLSENNAIKHLFYNSLGLWKVNDAMKSSEGIIELLKAAGRSAGIVQ